MSSSGPVWSLKGIAGEFQGNTLPLKAPLMTIGRTVENHIVISDTNISRHHATIYLNREKIQIQDEESRNGVILNDRKIEAGKRFDLKHGDKIMMGPHGFVIEMDDDARFNPAHQTQTRELPAPPKKTKASTQATTVAKPPIAENLKEKLKNLNLPKIEWNRRTLMYTGLGVFILMVAIMQIPPSEPKKPAQKKETTEAAAPTKVDIKSDPTNTPPANMTSNELDALKARAKASLQFQDYLAATELYEKIVKAQPQDEYVKTQYEFSKKQLKRLIERHLEYAKREYEKLNYERAIIEWKQVLALTSKADPDVYKQTEIKIRDAEKEIRKRR